MTEVFVNDSLKIIQDKNNKTIYRIEFNYPCPSLIRSLIRTNIIQGTITDDYLTVRFKAVSVVPFPKSGHQNRENKDADRKGHDRRVPRIVHLEVGLDSNTCIMSL